MQLKKEVVIRGNERRWVVSAGIFLYGTLLDAARGEKQRLQKHIDSIEQNYVMDLLNQGKDVILEIDIQGALQIKKRFPDGVFVFIVPPSLDELSSRIYKRGTDSEEVIKKRLASATGELLTPVNMIIL